MDDLKKARQKRFASKVNEPRELGLLSRGEDTRLRDDAQLQSDFYNTLKAKFDGITSRSSESICQHSVDNLLMDLRKLREALLANPESAFSVEVFEFCVRAGLYARDYRAYLPAMRYLLECDNKFISKQRQSEIAELLAVHLCLERRENTEAFEVLLQYECPHRSWALIRALMNRNPILLGKLECDDNRKVQYLLTSKKLCEVAKPVLTAAYFTLPANYLNQYRIAISPDWVMDNGTVIIRKQKSKRK